MLSRWIAALIVPLIGIMALGFVAMTSEPLSCLDLSVGLLIWGIGCCLVGTCLCAMLFAVCRAPRVAYVVLIAAMTLVAWAGSNLRYAINCTNWGESVLGVAGLCLVASLVGLLLGYLLGRLLGYLLDGLVRWWRRA